MSKPSEAHDPDGVRLLACPFCRGEAERYIPDIVRNAMLTMWNEICADTGHHPLDIKHGANGRKLYFAPRHWAQMVGDMVTKNLADLRAALVPQCDAEPDAWLYEMAFKIKPSDESPFSNWKQVVSVTPPPTIPKDGVRNVTPLYAAPARCDAGSVEAAEIVRELRWRSNDTDFDTECQRVFAKAADLLSATPPALPAGEEADENALWALACELHSNVPEDQRPMSWSDFSPEQIERLHRAANAFLRALSPSSNGKPATEK